MVKRTKQFNMEEIPKYMSGEKRQNDIQNILHSC